MTFASVLGVKSKSVGFMTDLLQYPSERFLVGMGQGTITNIPVASDCIITRLMASYNNAQSSQNHYIAFALYPSTSALYIGYYWSGLTESIVWKKIGLTSLQ